MTPEVSTLTLRDLEYVIAIAEHKNFRLAAKSCAVSQPALSAQIKKMEAALDIQIFERTNREVLVTTVGQQIVEQSRVILEELEVLGSIARGADKPLEGVFRLGIVSTLSSYLLPPLLTPFGKEYPKAELVLREAVLSELLEDLRIGKLDAVIGPLPIPRASGKFESCPLFCEPLSVALRHSHSLAKRKKIAPKILDPDNIILLDEKHSLTQITLELLESTQTENPAQYTFTTSIESMCSMIASSYRFGVVPFLSTMALKRKDVVFRPLTGGSSRREIGFIWRPRYRGAQTLKKFGPKLSEIILRTFTGVQSPKRG